MEAACAANRAPDASSARPQGQLASGVQGLMQGLWSRVSPRLLPRAGSLSMQAATALPLPDLGPVRLGPELLPHAQLPVSQPLGCATFPNLQLDSLHGPPQAVLPAGHVPPPAIRVVQRRGKPDTAAGDTANDAEGVAANLEKSSHGGGSAAAALLSASSGRSADIGSAMDALWSGAHAGAAEKSQPDSTAGQNSA